MENFSKLHGTVKGIMYVSSIRWQDFTAGFAVTILNINLYALSIEITRRINEV